MKFFVLAAMAFAVATPALAANNANEVYGGVGTTGITVGFGHAIGARSGFRVEGDFLNYSRSFNTNSANYNGKMKIQSLGAYYDLFIGGPFRVTGGLLVGTREFSGSGIGTSGSFTINHQQYSATGEYVKAKAKYGTVSPYLGLGWGHRPSRGGFGFYGDVGVVYGHPNVTLNVSPGLQAAAGAANVSAEKSSLQSKANSLNLYPVIRVGVDYQW